MSPQTLLLAMAAVATGALFPVQAAVNAQLAGYVGGAFAATTISVVTSLCLLLFVNGLWLHQFPSFSAIARTPYYVLWLGGAIGVTFLTANVWLAPRLGTGALFCLAIAGQLTAALAIDRFGLFAFAARDITPGRIVGVALVFAGALMVRLT